MARYLWKNKEVLFLFALIGGTSYQDATMGFSLSFMLGLYLAWTVWRYMSRLGNTDKHDSEASALLKYAMYRVLCTTALFIFTCYGVAHLYIAIINRQHSDRKLLETYKQEHGVYPETLELLNQSIPQCPGDMHVKPNYAAFDGGANYCWGCPAIMGDDYRYCSEDKKWDVF